MSGAGLSRRCPIFASPGSVACCGSYRRSSYEASRSVTPLGATIFARSNAPRRNGSSRTSPIPPNLHCMRPLRAPWNRSPLRRLSWPQRGCSAQPSLRTIRCALNLHAGRVAGVETNAVLLFADEIVVAAGVRTADLVATAGLTLPITASPALLVRTQPHAKLLNGLVMSPAMQLRQTPEGQLVAAVNFRDGNVDADGAVAAAAAFDTLREMIVSDAS